MNTVVFPRPLTLDPVIARLADRPCSAHDAARCNELGCDTAIAEALGRTRRSITRYKAEGLTVTVADDIAVALGTHPAELWGTTAWNHAQLVHDHALGLEELDA